MTAVAGGRALGPMTSLNVDGLDGLDDADDDRRRNT